MSTLIACWIAAAVVSTAVSLAIHGPLLLLGFLEEREWSQLEGSSELPITFAAFERLNEQIRGSQMSDEEFQRLAEKAVENMSPDEVSHMVDTLLELGRRDLSTVSRPLGEAPINR